MYESINRRVRQGLGWAEVGDYRNLQEDFDLGSVTNPAGSVNGKDLSGLIDATTYAFSGYTEPPGGGVMAQWQHLVLLTNVADPCGRYGGGGSFAPSEITLRFVLLGYNELPDAAPVYPPTSDVPITFTANVTTDTSDGVHRVCKPYVNQARKNGATGNDTAATGGTVTFTRADSGGYEGSYDLTFPSGGSAAGSFSSPWCGTPPA